MLAANLQQSRRKAAKFRTTNQEAINTIPSEDDYRFSNYLQNSNINPFQKTFNTESNVQNIWQPPVQISENIQPFIEHNDRENQTVDSDSSTITGKLEGSS